MTEQLPIRTTPQPFRLSIDDFLLLDRSGAMDGYAKTELLQGGRSFLHEFMVSAPCSCEVQALFRFGSGASVLRPA